MPLFLRILLLLAVALGGFYVLVCVVLFVKQREFIYPAPRAPLRTPPQQLGYRVLAQPQGDALHVLDLPGPAGAPTVVYLHGNGEQLLDCLGMGEWMQEQGLGFLAVEYPGYGFAPGAPTEKGIYAVGEAALAFLRARGVRPQDTVLFGRSLGTGVAVEMGRRGRAARMVLVSPYTSMADLAHQAFRWLPTRMLLRDRYDSERKAADLKVPVLVLHGEQDTLIPVEMGRRLAERLPDARFIPVPRVGHSDILASLEDPLLGRIAAFARHGHTE